ncbi:MAG: hypothetical protein IT361_13090 [Gemmatimonadaceae bacterium]|nr:hypothetical protein [Gemmatimonadaceae bacterium]
MPGRDVPPIAGRETVEREVQEARRLSRHAGPKAGAAWRRALLVIAMLACLRPRDAVAQAGNTAEAALVRALDLEGDNKCREAIPLFRQAVQVPDPTGAILGLERCYSIVGRPDSILALLDTLLVQKPGDPTLRTVQLRTLSTVRRDADLAAAFQAWIAVAPAEATPWRVYAQLMLDNGRAMAADSILRGAAVALGNTRALASEFAQMQAALGLWVPSARSWRSAAESLSYLEQAAVFSLMPVPVTARDSIRDVFTAAPATLGARRILAGLELRWHAPRDAWRVLSELPVTDSTVAAWIVFGGEAESEQSWLTARDAYARAAAARPNDRKLALRAASAAMTGGDPRSALDLLAPLAPVTDPAVSASALLLQVQALGALGRPQAAESVLTARGQGLDAPTSKLAQRAMAWAWIRGGDLARANAALDSAGRETDEGERVAAWIALYQGDLATARRGLRRTDEPSNDVVTAMALLSRTRADSSPAVGRAFLTLARGDTAIAAREFEQVAGTLSDAAPFLTGVAARLFLATQDTARAIDLWRDLLQRQEQAPEAAEADLAWARVLRVRGDSAGAVRHLEHLILTWSQSALVPQARRELDILRGAIPPSAAAAAWSDERRRTVAADAA